MFDPVARSKCLHNHVFGMLPEPAVARKLTKAYLEGPFHHGWPIIHTPSFKREETAFFALPPNIQRVSTDPAWIALYMMVIGLGIKTLPPNEALALLTDHHSEEIERLPRAYYHASVLALEVANVDVVPQIRHIQVGKTVVKLNLRR
ncbi:hypothetical protein HWV62_45216 [Athelia sp. TMB]|nr:hypothetical protein HWV62_45216 [Athelia sp. TMB]